jgi:hypothetical protein
VRDRQCTVTRFGASAVESTVVRDNPVDAVALRRVETSVRADDQSAESRSAAPHRRSRFGHRPRARLSGLNVAEVGARDLADGQRHAVQDSSDAQTLCNQSSGARHAIPPDVRPSDLVGERCSIDQRTPRLLACEHHRRAPIGRSGATARGVCCGDSLKAGGREPGRRVSCAVAARVVAMCT